MAWDQWRITGSGVGPDGWIVDIHDGERNVVYRPVADDLAAALTAAEDEHRAAYFTVPPPPHADEPVTVAEPDPTPAPKALSRPNAPRRTPLSFPTPAAIDGA